MPSRTSLATRSILLLVAAALTAAAVQGARPTPAGSAGLRARYGAPVAMGNGQARTYVVVDERSGNPVEVGVALSAQALEGSSSHSPDHGPGTHGPYSEYLLELPAGNPTPYRFVEVDWNPHGHGGPYTAPHFDFHFYRVPVATRNGIDLADPDFATKAARLPAAEEIPAPLRVDPRPAQHDAGRDDGAPDGVALDRHGVARAAALEPAVHADIVGSWNGQVIFDEPMVTRAFILAQRSGPATAGAIALPPARRYAPAGFYPASYGVRCEEAAGEYRIALQELSWRD
jgi:hypothetical protein